MGVKNREQHIEKYREYAKKLVSQMTLEEKVEQTMNAAPAILRLGIPTYNWWNEALHGVARAGVATVFPQAIGLAATFDEDFVKTIADAVSTEGRGKFNMQQKYQDSNIFKGLTFWAPNVNIFRDPRWGRGHETFGEDPYLTSRLGVGYVKGLQGEDEQFLKSAACAKHFAVHSGPEGDRHEFNSVVSKQDLYETYLPAFKACVQEGEVEAVMGAYNCVNGEPSCGSKTLLKDILRDEWGFKGHVVSDCGAIRDFHDGHHVTSGPAESAAMAMNNGCDLNCGCMFEYLKMAAEMGILDEARLDEAVTNLMVARQRLGILNKEDRRENVFDLIPYSVVDCEEHRELNKESAIRSIVLLKNENKLLPLNKNNLKTVGVIGPNANNRRALTGNYEGTASAYWTVLEGLKEYLEPAIKVRYSEGCHLWDKITVGLAEENNLRAEVQAVCEESDVIIACLGLDATFEGEQGDAWNTNASGDKLNLQFPGIQQEVLEIIHASGKPVVLLVLSGSALAIDWADKYIPAIMQCWYPGGEGGRAIASVLFGERSPEGKLPITFYKESYQLPGFSDYSMKGRTYRYMKEDALYPFGYGLSYTEFVYGDVKIQDCGLEKGMDITVSVKNVGKYASRETVQVYVKIEKDNTPNAQLKYVHKLFLSPEEEKTITMHLPEESFGLYDANGVFHTHKECATIYVGGNGPDRRSKELVEANK